MLLEEETDCFCFLAGHESFVPQRVRSVSQRKQTKSVKNQLRVILKRSGKDAFQIISVSTALHIETEMDYYTGEVKELWRKILPKGLRAKENCYGANDVTEGVAIMWKEGVDVSITGNSTNPTRFQHPGSRYI